MVGTSIIFKSTLTEQNEMISDNGISPLTHPSQFSPLSPDIFLYLTANITPQLPLAPNITSPGQNEAPIPLMALRTSNNLTPEHLYQMQYKNTSENDRYHATISP